MTEATPAISNSSSLERNTVADRLPKYIPQFDGLRAIAVMAVLVSHLAPLRLVPWLYRAEYGRVGVDLFFVLSGFLITGILLDTKDSAHYFRNFYLRRILRIWPLYYLFLAFTFLFMFSREPEAAREDAWRYWPLHVLYFQNLIPHLHWAKALTHTWSLAIEEQFYMFWPALVGFLSRRKLFAALAGMLVISNVSRIAAAHIGVSHPFLHRFTIFRLDPILLGSLVALLFRTPGISERQFRKWSIWAIVAGVGGTVACHLQSQTEPAVYAYPFIGLAFAGLMVTSLFSSPSVGVLGRILTVAPLRYIGKISYGVYLLQVPVILLFGAWMPELWLARPTFLSIFLISAAETLITIGVATISWYAYERPILGLKDRFTIRA